MRKRNERLKQKEKVRLSIFIRPDQYTELLNIQESEDTYMLDIIEEMIDLGLRVYSGDTRDIGEAPEGPAFLYD